MRIIWEIKVEAKDSNLAELFSEARGKREEFDQQLETFESQFKSESLEHINGIFDYLLIEVEKDYKANDFKCLKDEALTTFFYEVPDYRRKRKTIVEQIGDLLRGSLFIPKTIIRLSRPSVITSEMSPFLRAEVINILYDVCLYPKRRMGREEITERMYATMKQYLGQVLFNTEMSVANVELAKSVNTLSVLMGMGAIAGILAVIAFVPSFFCKQNVFLFQTYAGLPLLIWAVSILFYTVWRGCFSKHRG